jgi:hypothetical protein
MCQRRCIKAWDSQCCVKLNFDDDIHELVKKRDLLETLGIQHPGLISTSNACTCTNLIYVQIVSIDLISHIMCQNVSRASRKFWYLKVVAVEGARTQNLLNKRYSYIYQAAACTSVWCGTKSCMLNSKSFATDHAFWQVHEYHPQNSILHKTDYLRL